MPLGSVLYESGDVLRHIYFPTDCIVSLLYVMKDGRRLKLRWWVTKAPSASRCSWAAKHTPSRAIVQSAGFAYRLTGARLKQEFSRHGQLLHILLRYTQSLITQMAQTAVCNRHHSVDQQLCRWLLLSLDRLPSSRLKMTQELIANMLGVRREGVTLAAGKLQEQGVIRYSRGKITVLIGPSSSGCVASATPWSSKRPIGCCRIIIVGLRMTTPCPSTQSQETYARVIS